jgi:hypothetical protein
MLVEKWKQVSEKAKNILEKFENNDLEQNKRILGYSIQKD